VYAEYDFAKDEKNIIKLLRVVKKFIDENELSRKGYKNFDEFHKFLNGLISNLKSFIEEDKYSGHQYLWKTYKKNDETPEGYSNILKFTGQSSAKKLVEEVIGEYCYKNNIKLQLESGLGQNPVNFKDGKCKQKTLILAKIPRNVNLNEEYLKELRSDLKKKKINLCYYLIFVDEKSSLEKLGESLQELEKFDFKGIKFYPTLINSTQNRDLDLSDLECSQMSMEKEVFVSYARGNLSGEIVDELCDVLGAANIRVVRDSEELRYKDSLKQFMQRLGKGKCLIVVISDKYLKSRYCMYELTEFIKNGEFKERIVPLVLEDASIYDTVDIIQYTKFWENKHREAEETIKKVGLSNISNNIREDIDLYSEITRTISHFIGELRDFVVSPITVHKDSDFNDIIEEINKILS
ncbi:toll/interleukin-1 receptor domain-containing protein, partial [filamentous cyanobacterium LEGE 11480]